MCWHGTFTQQMAVPGTGWKFVPINASQDPAASLRGCMQVLMCEELWGSRLQPDPKWLLTFKMLAVFQRSELPGKLCFGTSSWVPSVTFGSEVPMLLLRLKRRELWIHCGGHIPENTMAAVGAMQSGRFCLDIPLENRHHSGLWSDDSELRVNTCAVSLDSDYA